jgi:predicted Zn-dependent protease
MTDPELDLLRELLEEDPANEVFLDVAKELARRSLWPDVTDVLKAAMPQAPDRREGWDLYAKAAVQAERWADALTALKVLDPDPQRSPDLAELEIFATHGIGEHERARERGEALLMLHPDRKAVRELITRHQPPKDGKATSLHGDPLINKARAEAYVKVGRVDRAVRWYRRILYLYPGDRESRKRLQVLLDQPVEITEDLSEELPDPSLPPPPGLRMPSPYMGGFDEEVTDPTMVAPSMLTKVPDSGLTSGERPAVRRRSLIGRK